MISAGTRVRRNTDPGRIGFATGNRQQRSTYVAIEVELADGMRVWWHEHLVEAAPIQVRRDEAFATGRFGRVEDLRRSLMAEKIRGDLTDVFYSMGTSNTDFYPHQFKPVLRFVESVTGRLLIADEVGLGKTIEALLIWKELEAREQARRLLIVCPSLLREKWRDELLNRFRIRADIANAAQVFAKSRDALHDRSVSFAMIAGYEGLRPPKTANLSRGNARSQYAQLLSDAEPDDDGALYDLVIMDEAHYARNQETATNRLVRALNACASNLIFLTATPIQISDDNLFQILRLVDPDRFGDAEIFARLIQSNEPIVRAYRALLNPTIGTQDARAALEIARSGNHKADPVVLAALEELDRCEKLSPERRVALARSIERISVLAPSMTRSRKKDVLENRVIRDPMVIRVILSPAERKVYDEITKAVIEQAGLLKDRDIVGRFALITRQRQMASSINAALRVISKTINIKEALFEDFGQVADDESIEDTDEDDEAPIIQAVSAGLGGLKQIPDSKFEALKTILRERIAINPKEKFVLFSYFRETLSYLAERLQREGVKHFKIQGGMGDEKWTVLNGFRDEDGPSILLSSEIGSEGIDLQFCRVLINYDLPWNPMKIEQRIGRLDRLGQEAERIQIFNFAIDETIEERILLRLHERVGVFERSLGDVEQILGQDVYKLVLDLFRDGLSDQQREVQAEFNIQAIAQRTHQVEEMENEAGNLVAFSDYILSEVRTSRDLGRFIEPSAIWTFICELLAERYAGTRIEALPNHEGASRLTLSADAKADFSQFLANTPSLRLTRLAEHGATVNVTSDPRWNGTLRPPPETLDATHPLVLWMREIIKENSASIYPVSAVRLDLDKASGVKPGSYVYVIDRFSFRGLRRETKLRYAAINLQDGERLSARDAEMLVHEAARAGATLNSIDLEAIVPNLIGPARELANTCAIETADHEESLIQENLSLCDRQLEAVVSRRVKLISEIEARLAVAKQSDDANLRRTIGLREAELRKARDRFEAQIRKIEKNKTPLSERSEAAAGFVMVI
jgi:superfamily II DNA or RNA helicase